MFRYILFLALIAPLPAFAGDYTCPEDTKTGQSVSRLPHGWLSSTLTANIPEADILTVFDGPPGEMASLVPDNEGADAAVYWSFKAEKDRPIWMQCGYAGQTTYLMRPLPDATTKCTQTAARTLSCE